MSVTNAISGIIIIGGMLQISGDLTAPTTILGAIAILVGHHQHFGRLPGHPAHVEDVPQVVAEMPAAVDC
jgi:hypothetical protein